MLSKTHTKYIQSLHLKKTRDALGLFLAEGTKVVCELLKDAKFVCVEICATENWLLEQSTFLQKNSTATCNTCTPEELQKISALANASSVLAIFEYATISGVPKNHNGITLVLDGIQDPGNFGTIIRSADWFGVQEVICSKQCADRYNPKVVQSTMGSIGRIPILYAELEPWLHKQSLPIFAAAMDGLRLSAVDFSKPCIIIIGNEGKGISAELMAMATQKITIPKFGEAESLNAAIATSIILSRVMM